MLYHADIGVSCFTATHLSCAADLPRSRLHREISPDKGNLDLIYKVLSSQDYHTHSRLSAKVHKPSFSSYQSNKIGNRLNEELDITREAIALWAGYHDAHGRHLSLEGEAGANLVGSLVQVLGIERGTQAEGDTRAEENVVSQSGDTTVVDLGLFVDYS
jgi:hypothetical protein